MPFAMNQGARLHWRLQGAAAATPVVLLHSIGTDLTIYDRAAEILSDDLLVLKVDLRGHGASDATEGDYALDLLAADVLAAMDAAGIDRCAVAGFSFGSMIAQELAIQNPADVSALIALAGPCTWEAHQRPAIAARGTDALAHGMSAVLDATMARWFTPEFRQSAAALEARHTLLQRDPRGWAHAWQAISGLDTEARLRSLRIPALCVAGERDVSATPEAVRRIAAAIPGARYTELSGAPHMLFIEQPDAVAALIADFLSELSPPRPG